MSSSKRIAGDGDAMMLGMSSPTVCLFVDRETLTFGRETWSSWSSLRTKRGRAVVSNGHSLSQLPYQNPAIVSVQLNNPPTAAFTCSPYPIVPRTCRPARQELTPRGRTNRKYLQQRQRNASNNVVVPEPLLSKIKQYGEKKLEHPTMCAQI